MTVNTNEKVQEMEWALECASRIIKKKHEASLRQYKKVQASDVLLADLKKRLAEKDDMLGKLMSTVCTITAMDSANTRPQTITSRISVIVPVRNAGHELEQLLSKIRSQRKVDDVEIIIIDSESTDDSVQTAKQFGAKIISIKKSEFNHGGTRNLGAAEARGDYIVFTVQDAIPVSNYWLYNMVCSFIAYPELAALSTKQFVKPEADLFSLWSNENMINVLGFEGDTMYSLSEGSGDIDWGLFDNKTKRMLTFFDDVSSCIRRDVFQEIKFSPLINAEDIDFGTKLLDNRKPIAYLTSTGVYHWHEHGAGDVFKRNYIGTKAQIYTLRNYRSNDFDMYNINWKRMAENIIGLYNLISTAIAGLGDIGPSPIRSIKSFIEQFSKGMEASPDDIERAWKKLEGKGENSLYSLINEMFRDVPLEPERKYDFKQNFIIPLFMKRFEEFSEHICQKYQSLKGRENEFIDCIYKLFAVDTGTQLGFYYLEAENLNRLTPDLNRIDHLLARGVCYA
jgi:rhamnosyltransferase